MVRLMLAGFVVVAFAFVAPNVSAQSRDARLKQCKDKRQTCNYKCGEQAVPGEGLEQSCLNECTRWFNACRGSGRGPTARNKSNDPNAKR